MPNALASCTAAVLSRVAALVLAALLAACGATSLESTQQQDLSGTRVRVMEANLTTGNLQAYEDPGIRIFQSVKPDIALVQEFNYKTDSQADLDAFVAAAFGPTYHYFRESSAAFQIPNGVVTRYPIVGSGSWVDPQVSNRGFAWARMQVPDGKLLWAFSLHLLTSGDRNAEATALVAQIKANVPADDYVVIGGDFNTGTRTEACVVTLSQVVATAGPFPADNAGNQNTSGNRTKPHDWVLADPKLEAQKTPVVIGADTFNDGLVVDTRVYTPLADLAPAQQGDSGAPSMQHMGVVRDFLLAGNAPPPPPPPPPPADGFEPDDTPAQAHAIVLGVPQLHDLSPATDVDWVTFTIAAAANVRIETSGPAGGDTMLRLYDSTGKKQLSQNDNSGVGNYSLIQKPALAAGTYLVKVASKNATVILGYSLKVSSY